jgi:hypothetical protein
MTYGLIKSVIEYIFLVRIFIFLVHQTGLRFNIDRDYIV